MISSFLSLHAQNRAYLLINPATSICQSTTLKNFQHFFLDNDFTLLTYNNKNSIRTYLNENGLEAYLKLPMSEISGNLTRPLLFSEIQIKRNDSLLSTYQVCKINTISDILKLDMELNHLHSTEKIPDTLKDYAFIDFDRQSGVLVYRRYPETVLRLKDQSDLWKSINLEKIDYQELIYALFTSGEDRKRYMENYEIVRKEFKKFIDIESFYLSDSLIITGLQVYVPFFNHGQYLLNPYHVLAIYHLNGEDMDLFGINSSVRMTGSEYNGSFRGGFQYSGPEELNLPIESQNSKKKYFLARFKKSGNGFDLLSGYEMELPDFFRSNNLGYNFSDKIFSGDYMLFKWSSDLYNLKSGEHILLDSLALKNEPGASADVSFFITDFKSNGDSIQLMAIVDNHYEYRVYDKKGKYLNSISYPITYREYCSYPKFYGKDKFTLINCNKNRLEIYSIREIGKH